MFADIWMYIVALLSNWASLIWGTSLIFDVGGLVLRKNQYLSISNWLDQYIVEETRVVVLRTLLVVGLLIAGFNAWDEQYQTAIKSAHLPPSTATMFARRRLLPDQEESLATSLATITFVHTVKIEASDRDPEAWEYATDFERVFKRAGWTIADDGVFNSANGGAGIALLLAGPNDWKTSYGDQLDAAFARAQLRIWGRGVDPALPVNQIELSVGYNSGS